MIDEILNADSKKKDLLFELIKRYELVELLMNQEILELSEKYIEEDVLNKNNFEDAKHAAISTVFQMDAVISWNLKHLANLRRMELINGVNSKMGYNKRLELITPLEVSDAEI